jgi:hypothetical protein
MNFMIPIPKDFVETIFKRDLEFAYKGQPLDPIQLQELRRCFFAAYWSALTEMTEVSSKLPEETAFAVIQSMLDECQTHAKEVLQRWYKSN